MGWSQNPRFYCSPMQPRQSERETAAMPLADRPYFYMEGGELPI